MTFFDFDLHPKEIAAGKFIGETQRELVRQLIQAKFRDPSISQAQVARMIDSDKATVTRILSGKGNITLRKLAEIAWALGLDPKVVFDRVEKSGDNHRRHYSQRRSSAAVDWAGAHETPDVVKSVVKPQVHLGDGYGV